MKQIEWQKPKFNDAAVLIGFDKENFALQLETLSVSTKKLPQKVIDRFRKRFKGKYDGKAGRWYAIAFYTIEGERLEVTDFFRGCLVDPKFYVQNLYKSSDILAIAADQFTLAHIWRSDAANDTDEGLYSRLVEMLGLFWKAASDLTEQGSVEYYRDNVQK